VSRMGLGRLIRSLVIMGGAQMVPKDKALPGRSSPMKVAAKHYVLGTSMQGPWPPGAEVIVLASGCFWGSEKGIWRLPGGGIISTAVGYAAGFTPNPTYDEVCSGLTGHTEAVQVVYDPAKISVVDILRWHWQCHDPTQLNRQGNDVGTQYRSGVYYTTEDQKKLVEASKAAYEKALMAKGHGKIASEVRPASDFGQVFYYAEDYHQQYLAKPGARPYCSAQPRVVDLPPFDQWAPKELLDKHKPRLPEAFWQEHAPTPHCVIRAPHEPIKWEL